MEIWGDGEQSRSFLYVDDCLEGITRLVRSTFPGPVNIGSEELVTINELAHSIMRIAGKQIRIRHVPGPQGVRGRNSDNRLIEQMHGWKPTYPLAKGLEHTYRWIETQVKRNASHEKPSISNIHSL